MYVSPSEEFPLYWGDIQREHPDWNEGDDLPEGWIKVTNDTPPEGFHIWPEFGEGQDETNTPPIKSTSYKPTLDTDDYSVVWTEVVTDLPDPADGGHPHEHR